MANAINRKSRNAPESFLQAVEQTEQGGVDLNDPIYNNALFQKMSPFQIAPNEKVKQIIAKAQSDEDYSAYIHDTIERCKKEIARDA